MTRGILLGIAIGCLLPAAAAAESVEKALAKMPPDERSQQACSLRGLDAVRREPALRTADRMKTSIFSQPVLEGTRLTVKGGAVRAGGHWYALSFTCDLTADFMKATTFTYMRGTEIPERDWDRLGLWR